MVSRWSIIQQCDFVHQRFIAIPLMLYGSKSLYICKLLNSLVVHLCKVQRMICCSEVPMAGHSFWSPVPPICHLWPSPLWSPQSAFFWGGGALKMEWQQWWTFSSLGGNGCHMDDGYSQSPFYMACRIDCTQVYNILSPGNFLVFLHWCQFEIDFFLMMQIRG